MSETPWQVLGVDHEADVKTIKRAYARALKSARPDEDAEGFQRLNDAYEWALAEARERAFEATRQAAVDAATAAHVDPVAPMERVSTAGLPELGRPLGPTQDAAPPRGAEEEDRIGVEASRPDAAEGFDFTAFFDALAPRLSNTPPRELRRWLEDNPALYAIDLKWALIPHVVGALASHVEAIAPRRAHVDVLLAFFGIDARLRRHPDLAGPLDAIDGYLDAARHAEPRPIPFSTPTPLDHALDAWTLDEQVAELRRQVRDGLRGRSGMLGVDKARLLHLAISDLPKWRLLLAFAMPGRFRDEAYQDLDPMLERFAEWQAAGIALPALTTVRALVEPFAMTSERLQSLMLRLGIALLAAVTGVVTWQLFDDASSMSGVGALFAVAGLMVSALGAIVAFATLIGLLMVGFGHLLRRLWHGMSPWVGRQVWDPIRWTAAAVCMLVPWTGWPASVGYSLALGFTGLAIAALFRGREMFLTLLAATAVLLVLVVFLGVDIEAPDDFIRIAMGVVAAGFFIHERWVEGRPWRRRGHPPEGWEGAARSAWMALVVWCIALAAS